MAFTRRGFWIGGAPGAGSAWQRCGGCADEDRLGGATFSTSVGWGLSDRWILVAEPYVWLSGKGAFTPDHEDEIQRSDFGVHLLFYPGSRLGWFARAGLGYSAYATNIGTLWRGADGFSLRSGAGHDWRVGDQLVLRAQALVHVGWLGAVRGWTPDLRYVRVASAATQYIVGVDFGLYFHPR